MSIESHRYVKEEFTETMRVSADSADITKHDAVKLVGENEVAVTDAVGDAVHGIATSDMGPNDEVGVCLLGQYPANVANPDGTVAAGADLVASDTAGQLRPVNTGGATGETGEFKTITGEDGDGLATVLLR